MRKATIVSHLKPEELKGYMLASKDRQQFQRWQVIFIMSTQKYRADEVAELVGVTKGTVYQWVHTHVYSAVCPIDGDSFSLILPYANTEMMTIFLREFSEYSQKYRIVMVMDGASWHKSKKLELYDNIRIIHQPPYSPEVNPVEHLWEHLREKYFRNGYWSTMDKLENDLTNALFEVSKSKETIQNLAGYYWAIF